MEDKKAEGKYRTQNHIIIPFFLILHLFLNISGRIVRYFGI